MKASLSPKQLEVFQLIQNKLGRENVFLVGGCLRDALMGKENFDMDFAVRNDPKNVVATFPYGLYYEKYGTVSFRLGRVDVTITSFRKEKSYLDHRHPSEVVFVKSLFEDYHRRDFTCDALYADWTLEVQDPTRLGIRDIRRQLVRTIGNPLKRLLEDPLRILRAYHFREELGFRFTRRLAKAIDKCKEKIFDLNPDRVRKEIYRFDATGRDHVIEELGLESLFADEPFYNR